MNSETPRSTRYRQTPFRRHVEQQMGWSGVLDWEKSLQQVLALDELQRRVVRSRAEKESVFNRKILTLERFFYRGLPDLTPYIPVKVRPERDDDDRYADLTELIQRLDADDDRRSILLATRSGAGKTVAARKAFCDCIVAAPDQPTPVLAGYLPCWIEVRETINKQDPIEHLILSACALERDKQLSVEGLRFWLVHSEFKLLLFFDLNAWAEKPRKQIVAGLRQFLETYQGVGHRAVVAYRSLSSDEVRETLTDSGHFQTFDLLPLSTHRAESYLRSIRNFEDDVCGQLSLPTPPRDIEAECQQLRTLIRQHTVGRAGNDSVISTPLLMHFCSLLDSKTLRSVRTLADLYDKVVTQLLDREAEGLRRAKSRLAKNLDHVRAALTRLAVLIVSRPEGSLALTEHAFRRALQEPKSGQADRRGGTAWWPQEKSWHKSFWVKHPYSEEDVEYLKEFSLLRMEGKELRFLHDSLIYYFAGTGALRWPEGASWPVTADPPSLPAKWPEQTARQLRAWKSSAREVAEFLGGSLQDADFQALFLELLAQPPDERTAQQLDGLIRGASKSVDVADRLQKESVRRSGWIGLRWFRGPDVLLPELHETLVTEQTDACTKLAEDLVKRIRRAKRPWLRTRFARRRDPWQTMSLHGLEVECAAIWSNPTDPYDVRIVSGGRESNLILWDPETGEKLFQFEHENVVRCVIPLTDGKIASGDDDGIVWLWDPLTDRRNKVIELESGDSVDHLAALPNNGLVAGSHCGKVIQWNSSNGDPQTIIEHEGAIRGLLVLSDGSVVSGGADGTVRLWDPNDKVKVRKTVLRFDHESRMHEVTCLAALSDARVIAGCNTGWLFRLNPSLDSAESRIESANRLDVDASVGCITVLRGPPERVVIGLDPKNVDELRTYIWVWNQQTDKCEIDWEVGRDVCGLSEWRSDQFVAAVDFDFVQLWDVESDRMAVLIRHEGIVRGVLTLPDGSVASFGNDKTVRRCKPSSVEAANYAVNDPPPHDGHESAVACLDILPDGRVVSCDGVEGRVWNPATGSSTLITPPEPFEGVFGCQMALLNGHILFGGSHVVLWDPATGVTTSVNKRPQEQEIECFAKLADGRIVAGTFDGRVELWDPSMNRMIESRKIHKKQIADLIVLNDGYRIVTASSGGSVRLWNTSTGSCENMMSFNDGNDCQLTLLRDGRVIAWCNDMDEEDVDSEVLLWDPKANDDDVRSIFKASLEFNAVVELSDGRILAAVGFSLQIWDPMHSDSDAFDGDFEIHKLWTFDDGRLIVADSTDCLSVYQSLDQLLGEAGNQPIVSYPINCAVSCIACRRDSSDIYAGLENGEVLFLKAESPL